MRDHSFTCPHTFTHISHEQYMPLLSSEKNRCVYYSLLLFVIKKFTQYFPIFKGNYAACFKRVKLPSQAACMQHCMRTLRCGELLLWRQVGLSRQTLERSCSDSTRMSRPKLLENAGLPFKMQRWNQRIPGFRLQILDWRWHLDVAGTRRFTQVVTREDTPG